MAMLPVDTDLKEKERIIKAIRNWSRSEEKVLNIVAVPYSKYDVFEDIIIKYTSEGKKVLYIANDEESIRHRVNLLKQRGFDDYCYSMEGSSRVKEGKSLVLLTNEICRLVKDNYDLVIYDDIGGFPKYNKFEILDLLSVFYKNSRIICISIENIFQNAKSIQIPGRYKGSPMIEPRVITTRLDLNKEIPIVIYEYLQWSIKSNRNVIILTPGKDISERVHNYLLSIKDGLGTNVLHFENNNNQLNYFIEKQKGIIVTHNMDIINMKLSKTDFIIYFAENKVFEYKKLVYVCSKASNVEDNNFGEVLFLSNDISRDMENCKEIIRRFNKLIWDMGLVRV
ncbi:MAG: hypothetical protein GX895_00400 [Clostridiales bacterium]|uniref:hypothetical protein n=1 Tax=Clostridium sp. N3C TaxID=1776758 RepID=UPI00092DF71C|nr:hypothetical protein [Clostridium sp. N3C]NLZ47243.1 hypothetical protein [Clostridiales bacterium]SCN24985.1 Superfamily II DNA/RNA helicase required for DNA uptake (late competence protein) [Clostridium sp. N3C]